MVIRRRKTRKGTTTDTGSIPVESTDRPDWMTRLGWCVGRRHCADCPRVYRSTIDLNAVDYCKCECHEEVTNGDH